MRSVNVFMIQRPFDNPVPIKKIYEEFGGDSPRFGPLEGGDYNGPQYLCCVDRNVDFEGICEKYNYRYYPAYKFEVEEDKYNSEYEIRQTYFNREKPYCLEKHISNPYDSDEESK